MDDPVVFSQFLQNTLGITTPRVLTEITNFSETFQELLSATDSDIDTFVKETHSSNSARTANQRVLIPAATITSLKCILFELRDRDMCIALPNLTILQHLDQNQLTIMKNNRRTALSMDAVRRNQKLPDMTVPKLTATNFEQFNTAFSAVVRRQMSLSGASLSYLLRDNAVGNYDVLWPTREDKLHNCLRFDGPIFKDDSESLYSLVVQHIGSTGVGSNIVNQYKISKNGRQCYIELKAHFHNTSYIENNAAAANKTLSECKYYGDRRTSLCSHRGAENNQI